MYIARLSSIDFSHHHARDEYTTSFFASRLGLGNPTLIDPAPCTVQVTLVRNRAMFKPPQGTGCNRELSRKARKVITNDVLGAAGIQASALPEGCVLNPSKDLYLHQEEQANPARQGSIKCGFCGKTFKSQFYFDR